jgi:RNA polymerase sigma-70 factor (ECF subfamily)
VILVETKNAPAPAAPASLAAVHQQFARPLYGLCLRLLGNREAAEDAVGEVFVRLPRAMRTYDAAQPFANWLYRVASNHCMDLLRARRRERQFVSPEEEEALAVASPAASPLAELVDAERRARLHRAIEELPEPYRVPLVLRYFTGLDYGAIGGRLGLTSNHVGILLFRARQELRRALAGEQGDRKS